MFSPFRARCALDSRLGWVALVMLAALMSNVRANRMSSVKGWLRAAAPLRNSRRASEWR